MKHSVSTVMVSMSLMLFGVTVSQARTCSGNGDLVGSYGFVAARSLFPASAVNPPGSTAVTLPPAPVSPPGTTGATLPATAIGQLVMGASATSPFSTAGVIGFDGGGNLLASASGGTPNIPVGTYSVNTDCSISGTINNVFGTGTTVTTGTAPSTTFQGVIVDRGNEIDVTSGGSVITMKRTIQANGCSTASLNGNFGFATVGNTVTTPSSPTVSTTITASTVVGRLFADGSGNLLLDAPGAKSPLTAAQITGTYTVNSDCSGTASLVFSGGQIRNIRFAVVNESSCSLNNPAGSELDFAFSDSGFIGGGIAKQQ